MKLQTVVSEFKHITDSGVSEPGITFLEFSFCSLLFCVLVVLATVLWNYIDVSNGLMRVVDRYAGEIKSGAYRYHKSSSRYLIDFSLIQKELKDHILERAYSDLLLEARENDPSQLRLEFALTKVRINSHNGSIATIEEVDNSDIFQKGLADIPAFLMDGDFANGEIDFNSAIKKFVYEFGDSIAVPRYNYGLSLEDNAIFFDEVAIVAVRAVHRVAGSAFTRSMSDNQLAYVWDIKVTTLREGL